MNTNTRAGKNKFINLLLMLVIVVIIILLTVVIIHGDNKKNQPGSATKKITLTVLPGFTLNALKADISKVESVDTATSSDQTFATTIENDRLYVIKGSINSEKELQRRQNLINKVSTELRQMVVLTGGERQSLTELLNTESTALSSISTQFHEKQTNAADQALDANYQSFSTLIDHISILKVADDQQASEIIFLLSLQKMQEASLGAGKEEVATTDLQADQTTINGDIDAAKTLSQSVEQLVSTSSLPASTLKVVNNDISTSERDINAALNAANALIGILAY